MSIGETFKTVVQPPTAQFLVTTAGTTAEEVLSVVVEHLDHTEGVVACDNTRKAIHHLMAAIELLKSMENRIQVDHEGTPQ